MRGLDVRNKFLDFFERNGHTVVPGAPLVPFSDATLLFTNAGMVQFKDLFLGLEKRDFKRAVSVQKCVRAGGKHNDLEIVGHTARHHTFFEMLGNFSFGDYFKKEAIRFAWEFLTSELKLPVEKLWVTIYLDDDESYDLWQKNTAISPDRIVRLGEKDNFWSMGDTGPCGPCSEILIDRGESKGCGRPNCNVECDCDRHLELWNLVFMQYNRDSSGKLTPLPNPSIDTGLGLERICSVLQEVETNFETDLFAPIMAETGKIAGIPYKTGASHTVSFRVIADHSRSAAFLVTDGVLPSNEGRGYVLRRLIRRAARHGKMLGINKPFLFRIAGAAADSMGGFYPELLEKKDFILDVIRNEEERFESTLDHGLKILEEIILDNKTRGTNIIPGEDLFKLYDTYGFPVDLTKEVANERGLEVDSTGFKEAMDKQKSVARASWKGDGMKDSLNSFSVKLLNYSSTSFDGYEKNRIDTRVSAIFKNGEEIPVLEGEGGQADLLLDATVLYAESGGQRGDRGTIFSGSVELEVSDTKKYASDYFIHKCTVRSGSVKVGDTVTVSVDKEARHRTELNHSATHILHQALREVLGDHVKQAGSYVGPDRLRFDFSHFAAPSSKEIQKVESLVNRKIASDLGITTESLSFDEAVGSGAMALFGEKYGSTVRMVKIGEFSTELCGGTHASSTALIGLFRIVHEGGVAAGIRRIEAFTGLASYNFVIGELATLESVRGVLKTSRGSEEEKLKKVFSKLRETEKELARTTEKLLNANIDDITGDVKIVNGISVLVRRLEDTDIRNLRLFVDNAKQKIGSGVVVIGADIDSKASIIVGVTKDLSGRFHAGKIVGQLAALVSGKGGGRADLAQAGGPDTANLDKVLEFSYEVVKKACDE